MKLVLGITLVAVGCLAAGCGGSGGDAGREGLWGKADDVWNGRQVEVLLTEPHCDVCDAEDKEFLLERSPIIRRVVELLDAASESVDIAQFTFSRKEIEAAVLRAHQRGVGVRLAMNYQQAQGDNVATRLKAAGVDVRFVQGKQSGDWPGLLHAKFMLVDGKTLLLGSNNWSSTGTSINEENTLVVHGVPQDEFVGAFACDFEAIWEQRPDSAAGCSSEEVVFTPGSGPVGMIKDGVRGATESVDVLMHHLVFDDLVKVLAQAAERGVTVRVLVNAPDRGETGGKYWDRLRAAGGQVRYKQVSEEMYQLMHHKLAIIDDRILINGSGNWSGNAFFNNFEFYAWYQGTAVVLPFTRLFDRLWSWSLTANSLDSGYTAAVQDSLETKIFFGNLHAHYCLRNGSKILDDGKLEHEADGQMVSVSPEAGDDPARHAFEYARDIGGMSFLALSPHVVDDLPEDPPDLPSMSEEGYERLRRSAEAITAESGGGFLALASMEWNTNSLGNHVNIFGSEALCKVERGEFGLLYESFLPDRAREGDRVLLMFNHPRTFRTRDDVITGNWDQIYGIDLRDIPKNSQRSYKFNDYGLDDYPPLDQVRWDWIEDGVLPDPSVVSQTLGNIARVTDAYVRLMEITLGRGSEIAGTDRVNPDLVPDEETGEIVRVTKVRSDWDYYLLHGFRLAPAASHDNHYANWGTGHASRTGIIAPRLTESSLLAAIDRRSVYASEDENLEVRLYAEDRIRAGSVMLTLDDRIRLNVHLFDPDYAGAFEVGVFLGTVGDNEVRRVAALVDVPARLWQEIVVDLPGSGRHFVYVEVHEPGPDRMAWTAPVWIEKP